MKTKQYNYLILGLSRSGMASYQLIYNKHSKIYLYDCNQQLRQQVYLNTKDKDNVFVLQSLSNMIIEKVDIVILSPAFSLDNKYIKYANKLKKLVISELELGYQNCKNDFIAITGTNGKTTTTSLVSHILNVARIKNSAVGNIGVPVCSMINNGHKKDTFVCEVSSFQLEAIQTFKPKIAAILNIGVDHIDHHGSLNNYIKAKYSIANNLKSKDYLVINNNCHITKKLVNKVKCQVYYFDQYKMCKGVYVQDGNIYFNNGKKSTLVMPTQDIQLLGKHNLDNVLCSICCALLYGVKIKHIKDAVATFVALPHRLQHICTYNGIEYINDSKATNIDATIVATQSISKPITLILGGSDKGYDYKELFNNLPDNVTNIVGCGQVKQKLYNSALSCNKQITIFDTLKQASEYAVYITKPGGCVLLSPASASFDEFDGYATRGKEFEKYIREYSREN